MSRFQSILIKLFIGAWVGIIAASILQGKMAPQLNGITMPFLAVGTLIGSAIMAAMNRLMTNNDSQCLIYDCEESDRYIIAAAKTLQPDEVEKWFRHVIKNYLTDEGDEVWVLVHGTIIPLTYDDRDNLRAVMKLYKQSQAQAVLAEAPPKKHSQPKSGGGYAAMALPPATLPTDTAAQWQQYYMQAWHSGNQVALAQAAEVMRQYHIPLPRMVMVVLGLMFLFSCTQGKEKQLELVSIQRDTIPFDYYIVHGDSCIVRNQKGQHLMVDQSFKMEGLNIERITYRHKDSGAVFEEKLFWEMLGKHPNKGVSIPPYQDDWFWGKLPERVQTELQ